MHIISLSVKNYRGLDVDISQIDTRVLIVGKNDSGKTNLCSAIRQVLDINYRKNPLLVSDSTQCNEKDIRISLTLDIEGCSDANRSLIAKYIDTTYDEGKRRHETLTATYLGQYNKTTEQYDGVIVLGSKDKPSKAAAFLNDLDKVIALVYIYPNYDLVRDKQSFFKQKGLERTNNNTGFSEKLAEELDALNADLSEESAIKEMEGEISKAKAFDDIFEGTSFKISTNVKTSSLYKSLDVIPQEQNLPFGGNVGDGKRKTLSMILESLSFDSDKEQIWIVEEPENHLYPLLQKTLCKDLDAVGANQIIVTTHSPFVIDVMKMNQIMKISSSIGADGNRTTCIRKAGLNHNLFIEFGGLLNEQIGETFFYDRVLLVEGLSEMFFYNLLFIDDDDYRKQIVDKKIGIFAVEGVNFGPISHLLTSLGIKVMIKTDNDIFKVPKKEESRYAGFERCIDALPEGRQEALAHLLETDPKDLKTIFRFPKGGTSPIIEEKEDAIIDFFAQDSIYISKHNLGFEKDLLEFLGENDDVKSDLEYLKNAKVVNLHSYIVDNKIKLKITAANKDSVLVKFLSHE